MQHIFKKTLLVSALSMVIAPATYATNGLAPTGLGQVHKAMGGTAVANPENTMSMATNPAAGSFIEDGFDVGLELFVPVRETEVAAPFSPTRYTGNGTAAFAVPEGGYKKTLGNGLAVGLTMYGNGGMNTDYGVNPFGQFTPGPPTPPGSTAGTGIDFKQIFISPTISKKMGNHSVGLAVNLVGQTFKSKGVLGVNPAGTGTDTATGIGATIGYMGKISPTAMIGLSHRFKTKMGKFTDNANIFSTTAGQLDVPGATTLGISFNVTPKTKVAVDIQRIYYSKVKAIKDGFGWDDQDVVKLGLKHQINNKVALLGGFNYGQSPVTPLNVNQNILAPAVSEKHLSLGAEVKLNKKSSVSLSYVHAFENSVTNGPVTLRMAQDAVGIGYSRTF